MAKGFTFGKVKQQPEKEQKSDNTGVNVTDVLNDYLDEKEQQTIDVGNKIKELEYQLEMKNQRLEAALDTIDHLSAKVVELTEKNYELEETQVQEKTTVKTSYRPTGFKPIVDDETIAQMRVYAYSILYKKGTIKFYEKIGKKFGVSTGSAYKYTKEIYQGEDINSSD